MNEKKRFKLLDPELSPDESIRVHEEGYEDDQFVCEVEAREISDGYHTMSELYDHRMALNIALFQSLKRDYEIVKSKLHHDGTMFDGYFIVVANLTRIGQISYHYNLKYWDKFDLTEVDKIPWEYDGHTSYDVFERLLKL